MDDLLWVTDVTTTGRHVDVTADGRHRMRISAYGPRLFRVWIRGESTVERTWSIAPAARDGERAEMPAEGSSREEPGGREALELTVEEVEGEEREWIVAGDEVRAIVRERPVRIEWQRRVGDGWVTFLADRRTGAYRIGPTTGRVSHFHHHADGDRCFGLGEKAGPLERTGRAYEFRCLDALGYDAAETDPLYKHWPFLITRPASGGVVGVFWDNTANTRMSIAREKDNYHLPFRSWVAEGGDIDYWVMVEDDPQSVTASFVDLIGGTSYPPTWSLGYSGSTMHYTDAPNAAEQVVGFIDECREHEIPVDLFQLSSGYTMIDDRRYVFNWDRGRFPDPRAVTRAYADAGLHLAANIKPALLHDHPRYDEIRDGFVQVDGEPELSVFWDDLGSHLDFTNPKTIEWWGRNVREQLLEVGIEATWNDNNEFEVWSERAVCHGFGREIPMAMIRPVHTLLMAHTSSRAQHEFAPDKRQYLITRSGMPGSQRYAETWSGDNYSSWKTLRYNTLMGLGMSMSGMYRVGHDVGGFAGLKPSPELFVRWVQNGALHPRFTIHSWHDDGTVNEPWMYPDQLPAVRDAMRLRYRLMPYLAHLSWRAHAAHEPIIKPLSYGFPDDPAAWDEHTDFLLGDELLVASVVEEGEREHDVYLPEGGLGWFEFDGDGTHLAPGQRVRLDAPLEKLPLLVRAGGAVPVGEVVGSQTASDDTVRDLLLFPAPGSATTSGSVHADDGLTHSWRDGEYCLVAWEMRSSEERVEIDLEVSGSWTPPWGEINPVLPAWDARELVVNRR